MKKILLIVLLFAFKISAQTGNPTTIYLVRHAEKITTDPGNKDPLLSETGQSRAKVLAKKLKKVKLQNIYSTNYNRTKLTATPTAIRQHKTILFYDPQQLKNNANTILKDNQGKNVLIIGHSNTVLEMIEALGGKKPIDRITDQEYDYFFKLTINQDGSAIVSVSHYGQPNSNNEGEQMMKGK
ncbi:histidine phosphatase family protein [Flavobacterium sp. K5-23]|uniref:histidine phosphatase family protein n=1 Tax=Flavobacterium sp. K5-23 TaxID=2746225 RepID=UPI002010A7F5|nr:histidine phosphatase family protein [Flavobacterium sp. K5-23]UQD56521.1 histidine phosphatase family protein [Flavobacterium sp. K5-23]